MQYLGLTRADSHFQWPLFLLLLIYCCGLAGCTIKPAEPAMGPPLDNRTWLTTINAPPSLVLALRQGELGFVPASGEHVIPVRVFGRNGKRAPILFTHGLQSHSGWFAQSAAFLAGLGHPVYAMDRTGSGLSPAARGHVLDFHEWVQEIDQLARHVTARHGHERFYLVGHCFGAIPATLYAISHPEHLQGLILTTPAIHTHTSLPALDMLRIALSAEGTRNFQVSVPLAPESFTEIGQYQQFISDDPLALRGATGQFYLQVHLARKYITANLKQLHTPLLMVLAGDDPISDNAGNRRLFAQVPAVEKTLTEFADARHILEFSPKQQEFFQTLAGWLAYR